MSSYLRLFSRFIWRDLLKDWGRTGLTVFGIALGVSVLLAISLANYTALAKFKETVDLVAGKANLEILATSARGIDQSVLEQVTWLWQLNGKFTPVIKENVVLPWAWQIVLAHKKICCNFSVSICWPTLISRAFTRNHPILASFSVYSHRRQC